MGELYKSGSMGISDMRFVAFFSFSKKVTVTPPLAFFIVTYVYFFSIFFSIFFRRLSICM